MTDKGERTVTDQELLQAIGQVVESKIDPLRQDIHDLKDSVQRLEDRVDRLEIKVDQLEAKVDQLEAKVDQLEIRVGQLESRMDRLEEDVHGIHVYMDTELNRTLNLLLEGQQALWDRFLPREEFGPLEDRTEVLEYTVKRHSQEIRQLQLV